MALLASAALLSSAPAYADLNELEAAAGGEFGIGSAMQYGEADVQGKDFSSQVRICGLDVHLLPRDTRDRWNPVLARLWMLT